MVCLSHQAQQVSDLFPQDFALPISHVPPSVSAPCSSPLPTALTSGAASPGQFQALPCPLPPQKPFWSPWEPLACLPQKTRDHTHGTCRVQTQLHTDTQSHGNNHA